MIKKYRDSNTQTVIYSSIGRNHLEKGIENQDSIYFSRISPDTWYMALADGVSTAKHAKDGSMAAIKCVGYIAEQIKNDEVKIQDVDDIRKEYFRLWKSCFTDQWDTYATTINFVIGFKNDLLIGQLGDGLIVLNADDKSLVFCEEEEFYSTETYALGKYVRKSTFEMKYLTYGNHLSLYMVSDGVGKELVEETRTDLCQYMNQVVKKSESEIEQELVSWFHILDKKNGDDKSIGILTWEV